MTTLNQLKNIPLNTKIVSDINSTVDLNSLTTKQYTDDKFAAAIGAIENLDYTAFRVYADDTDDHTQYYEVGESCPQFIPKGVTSKNTLAKRVPKSQTIVFRLSISTTPSECDVIVDWGDGTISIAKNGLTESFTGDGYASSDSSGLVFVHKYDKEGSYLVKILGKDYTAIKNYWNTFKLKDNNNNDVEISCTGIGGDPIPWALTYEIFGNDTPVASCVFNLASFQAFNGRLLHVVGSDRFIDKTIRYVGNWSQCFLAATNLISVTNFYFSGYSIKCIQGCNSMFELCSALETYHGQIPTICASTSAYNAMFLDCKSLSSSVSGLLPTMGFITNKQNVGSMFANCPLLTIGDINKVAEILWNNIKITWSDTESCFKGCSDTLRAQVPVSWGGTNTEIIPLTKREKITITNLEEAVGIIVELAEALGRKVEVSLDE